MNKKLSASFFMLLTIVGIVLATYFYVKLRQTTRSLIHKEQIVQDKTKSLNMAQEALNITKDSLDDAMNALETQNTAMNEMLEKLAACNCNEELTIIQEKSKNVGYLVGIHSVGAENASQHSKVSNYLSKEGYTIYFSKNNQASRITDHSNPTILYYNEKDLPRAKTLSKELNNLTGKEYEIIAGGKNKKARTFIIQNM